MTIREQLTRFVETNDLEDCEALDLLLRYVEEQSDIDEEAFKEFLRWKYPPIKDA